MYIFVTLGREFKVVLYEQTRSHQRCTGHQVHTCRERRLAHVFGVFYIAFLVIIPAREGSARPVLDADPAESDDVQIIFDGTAVRLFQAFRRNPIVAIDEGNELSSRLPQDVVLDRAEARILLMNDAQPIITSGQ